MSYDENEMMELNKLLSSLCFAKRGSQELDDRVAAVLGQGRGPYTRNAEYARTLALKEVEAKMRLPDLAIFPDDCHAIELCIAAVEARKSRTARFNRAHAARSWWRYEIEPDADDGRLMVDRVVELEKAVAELQQRVRHKI